VGKKHKLFVNKTKILALLLEYGKPVEWRKKIIGYGLKGSDFSHLNQKDMKVSRDVFNDYKEELLSNRYITQLRTSDQRSHHYTITPYGIAYLMKNYNVTPTNIRRIFEILLFFYDGQLIKYGFLQKNKIDKKLTMKMLDIYKKRNMALTLDSTLKNNSSVMDDSIINGTLSVNFSDIDLVLVSIVIGKDYVNWIENHIGGNWEDFKFTLNDKKFFSYLSLYFLVIFFYNIFELQYVFVVNLINKSKKSQETESDDTIKMMKEIVTALLQHNKKQISYDMDFYLNKVYRNINPNLN